MDKHLKTQLEENFKSIPHLKDGFKESLGQTMDLDREIKEPLVSVGSANNLDWDIIFTSLDEYDIDYMFAELEHKQECDKCQQGEDCEELEDLENGIWDSSDSTMIYTDGEVKIVEEDGHFNWDVINAEVIIKYNCGYNTFQVLKSPNTTKHGYSSMCYPGQCDLDAEGDVLCYDLPDEYKHVDP